MKINQCAIIFGVLLALSQACQGHGEVKCYVCKNCDKITNSTMLVTCDASYFASLTTEIPSTLGTTITTDMPEISTVQTTTVQSLTDLPPTPVIETTTELPTPPTSEIPLNETLVITIPNNAAVPITRRRRALVDNEYTYHCYRVQTQENGVKSTSRGCARVTVQESVCGVVQKADNISSKCYSCSTTLCNGSGAIGVSVIVLFMTLFASLLSNH